VLGGSGAESTFDSFLIAFCIAFVLHWVAAGLEYHTCFVLELPLSAGWTVCRTFYFVFILVLICQSIFCGRTSSCLSVNQFKYMHMKTFSTKLWTSEICYSICVFVVVYICQSTVLLVHKHSCLSFIQFKCLQSQLDRHSP